MTRQSNMTDKASRREDAARFWSTHDVTVDNSDEVEEEIYVRTPLAASISLRLTDEEMSRLRTLAKANDVGVTTMARMLLRAGLAIHPPESVELRELDAVGADD